MGVRGLFSFVEGIEKLRETIKLQRDTKLVIDGSSLYKSLYEDSCLDERCGGQYAEYYDIMVHFFKTLESVGVESFVVLDGACTSDEKLDKDKKKSKETINKADMLSMDIWTYPRANELERVFVFPLLLRFVFVQALRDLKVKFAVSDGEADAEVASLANTLECPVLSNDSDFFILDVKRGFIPIRSFDWQRCPLTAPIFYRRKLAQYFGIRTELLPLFASLVGNDYVSLELLQQSLLETSGRKEEKFRKVSALLPQEPTSEEMAVDFVFRRDPRATKLRRAVEISLQKYTIRESPLAGYFLRNNVSSPLKNQNGQEIEEWVLRFFSDGRFSTSCMSCLVSGKVLLKSQVENFQVTSSNRCSQSLRKFTYGILASAPLGGGKRTTVQEWDRKGKQASSSSVSPADGENIPCLREIPKLDLENKLAMYLIALDANTTSIKSLPQELKLVAASLRFLYRKAAPKLEPNYLSAILCSCVKLEDGSWKEDLENSESQTFEVQAAHSFSQWQCVLRDAIHLNRVLGEPVQTPYIRNTFNGKLLHYLQWKLRGCQPESLIQTPSLSRYRDLYTAITNQEDQEVVAGMQNLRLQASRN